MYRLISENEVINAICNYKGKFYTIYAISKIPSAYKDMTNGEVIKAMFPQLMIFEENASKVVWGRSESETKWWNSPYEPQERSGEE